MFFHAWTRSAGQKAEQKNCAAHFFDQKKRGACCDKHHTHVAYTLIMTSISHDTLYNVGWCWCMPTKALQSLMMTPHKNVIPQLPHCIGQAVDVVSTILLWIFCPAQRHRTSLLRSERWRFNWRKWSIVRKKSSLLGVRSHPSWTQVVLRSSQK